MLNMPTYPPKVSVIIPVYNREKYIAETIESALSQTFQDIEILVIDDGSEDQSPEIAKRYAQKYPQKVKYLEHQNHRNYGVSASRNLGIHHAGGEYVAFLDSDDLWRPEKIERQVEILDNDPDVGLVYCALCVIDEQGNPTREMYGRNTIVGKISGKIEHAFDDFFSFSMTMWLGSTVLVRKHILFEVGLFDTDLAYQCEDAVLSHRIAYRHPIFFQPSLLVKYRVHSHNASWSWIHRKKDKKMRYHVLQKDYLWLKKVSKEFYSQNFRVRLANLAHQAYQEQMIGRWDFYKLLASLYPYRTPHWRTVKIFMTLLLGYPLTRRIQTLLNGIRGIFF